MTDSDHARFSTCLLAMSELYGKPVSPAMASLWWSALEQFDVGAIEDALARHMRNPDSGQFMPKPADVVRLIEGSTKDGAHEAWSKFDRAMRTVGPYQTVVFDDALIHCVVSDMGGWTLLGTKDEDEWPFIGNEFRTRYAGLRTRGEIPPYPPTLIGLAEAENGRKGMRGVEPVLIGDTKRAMFVMQDGAAGAVFRVRTLTEAASAEWPQLDAPGAATQRDLALG